MGYKILITEPIDKKGIDFLKEQGYEIRMGSGITEDILIEEGADCDGILTRNGNITGRVLQACKKLKVVSMHGVGVDCIDVEAAAKLGIQVTNAAQSNQRSVAEYAIGLILMLAKRAIHYNNGLKSGNMEVRKLYGSDVTGKTLGIIGMGNIGTQVAKMASFGLNMNVIGYSRKIRGTKKVDYALLTDNMEEVISSADFLSLHLPGSPSTRHIIGEKELSLMKPEAFLINTGRGEIIDEEALIRVLKDHRIMGAALDVFEGNLPKPDNPLLHMEHVIVTPHTAAFTAEALERMAYQSALGISEVLKGRPVSYPVNKLKDSFEENKGISAVMNYYRYEFQSKE
ncbi:hydroxyacid dehydrogenase [Anaerocolumna xylanovorans]|uniref:D-3-phosphoglycerate dehydrogenase n=1 Tax=Anaerocolumna xylanovorans DSM 12503 TaxID=1121345 RepID=A0A1M7Y4F7_9FIRM|nr:hydroxyacid dehydrogenase [Anaerocolumna xylanovorans]SHO46978.1 D-3-phosphoglycerate dehydrogenase [Anaerocolumna xylanovorans DSM 12503]